MGLHRAADDLHRHHRAVAGGTVATLPCDAGDAAVGEAVVSWDGRDGDGALVADGDYTWTVVAGDADGAAVDVDGMSTDLTGPISVRTFAPGTTYVPLKPARLLDTRTGRGATTGAVPARTEVRLQVTGHGGVPSSGVAAVVLNVTVTRAHGGGYVSVYPTGGAPPRASTVNFARGRTVANQTIARVGTGGRVSLRPSATTDLVADVAGYYPTGGSFTPLTPARLLDTRRSGGLSPTGGRTNVPVTGVAGIPGSGVAAVALNVAAVNPSANGYLTVHPGGSARPTASNVNFQAGRDYRRDGAGEGRYRRARSSLRQPVGRRRRRRHGMGPGRRRLQALDPARIVDTRSGLGATTAKVAARHTISVDVTGPGGVPLRGVHAVLLNVTVTAPEAGGYLTVYPGGTSRPTASNLNYVKSRTIANSVIAKVGSDGTVRVYVSSATHVVVDVGGWWTR